MAQPPNYSPPPQAQVPPKRSNTVLWVVIILGVGGLCMVAILVGAAILFPVFSQARLSAQKTACLSNVKQQALGLIMYAGDNNDRFPPAKSWMDKTGEYAGGEDTFRCPIVSKDVGAEAYGYGFNESLSQFVMSKVQSPEDTVSVFESQRTGRNAAGGQNDEAVPGRHGPTKGNNFGYVDGRAKFVPDGNTPHRWNP